MSKRSREESTISDEDADSSAPASRSASAEPDTHTPKYTQTDSTRIKSPTSAIRCLLPPHKPLTFATYTDYETHYHQAHTNRCIDCHRNFPTAHFLSLHIAENHDPLLAAKREQGEKTFACFVEGCEKVCGEWQKRRRHLVDKHGFPRNYDFFVVDAGVDGRWSMLRPGVDGKGHRKSSRERKGSEGTEATLATSVSEGDGGGVGVNDDEVENADVGEVSAVKEKPRSRSAVDDLTSSMSSLKMVPRSITFGKRKGRTGFATS